MAGPERPKRAYRPETLAVHLGLSPDERTGAVVPPIHLATTFERDEEQGYSRGFVYSRSHNPTRDDLEQALALLEGGREAAAFASGSMAASAVFRSLPAGSHVLVPDDMYHGLRSLLEKVLGPAGLAFSAVDMSRPELVAAAMQPSTRLLWIETPSNPLLKISDIAALVAVARGAEVGGAEPLLVALDATWTPPPWQPGFALGADLVVHSTTKYLSGHSDVLGGVVVAAPIAHPGFDPWPAIRDIQRLEGGVAAPFDCFLTLRGLRTLAVRLAAHARGAEAVAGFLSRHPAVLQVLYPGLPGHPGHDVAARQMATFGGMLSFRVRGGRQGAMRLKAGLQLFTRATSLGSVESLIEHRASVEPAGTSTPDDLLRVSVGLEHPDDLIDDLRSALDALVDP